MLVRAQLLAVLVSGLIFRNAWRDDDDPLLAAVTEANSVGDAALIAAGVCGQMVLYGVIAAMCGAMMGGGDGLLPLMEVAGGSARIAAMGLAEEAKLVLMGLALGFGGLCVLGQNMARLGPMGVPWHRLLLGKAVQGGLSAVFCGAQLRMGLAGGAAKMEASVAMDGAMLGCGVFVLILLGMWLFPRARSQRPEKVV